jgi:hypothetical protein
MAFTNSPGSGETRYTQSKPSSSYSGNYVGWNPQAWDPNVGNANTAQNFNHYQSNGTARESSSYSGGTPNQNPYSHSLSPKNQALQGFFKPAPNQVTSIPRSPMMTNSSFQIQNPFPAIGNPMDDAWAQTIDEFIQHKTREAYINNRLR